MNKKILNTGVQGFIQKNTDTDIMSVLVKKPFFEQISNRELAEQLEARQKCEKKLPTWFNTPHIYYPNKLNIEQTSSEITARYKAEIVIGKSLLDVTGGFGVDSYFFSKKIPRVFYCEIDKSLSQIAAHNFNVLNAKNIKTIYGDGILFLQQSNIEFDWLYIDPSRRPESDKRVFKLSESAPNVLEHLELLFSKSENILLKTAPLLDISLGIKELKRIVSIHVVAIDNDVKELLWILKRGYNGKIAVNTVNFRKKTAEIFNYFYMAEKNASVEYAAPQTYLYEPNSAIMKSGAFKSVAARFKLKKLHKHTHLYTSQELVHFPGRIFKIQQALPFNKRAIKILGIKKANVTARNFPENVMAVKKRFDLKDGGEDFLFFTTEPTGKKIVVACKKILNINP